MKICYFGDYNPEYSRNRILIKGLRDNDVEVYICNDHSIGIKKYYNLITKHRKIKNKYDVLIVGYSDSRTMVLLATLLSSKRIVWDAFYSLYDSWIHDRKLALKFSFKALYYWLLDWINCAVSDKILLDTNTHILYFTQTFHIKKSKFIRVFVGSDDSVFQKKETLKRKNYKFKVFFYGKFIPLQGIRYIIKAAKILEKYSDIIFHIVGSGQTYQDIRQLASQLHIKNIIFTSKVPYTDLPSLISSADICLGIFGDTNKALRVIPNKVYDAIAMEKPVITAKTPAIKELFMNKENILLCDIADENDLASKILELKNNTKLKNKIATKGCELFNKTLIPKKIAQGLLVDLYIS